MVCLRAHESVINSTRNLELLYIELHLSFVQHIDFLESENARLKKSLEQCEEALEMANQETSKSNEQLKEVKGQNAELHNRIADLESQVQSAGAKAKELEMLLKESDQKYAAMEDKMRAYQEKLGVAREDRAKFEKDLKGVHVGLQDREMKMEDLSQQIPQKEAVIDDVSKEVRISTCFHELITILFHSALNPATSSLCCRLSFIS